MIYDAIYWTVVETEQAPAVGDQAHTHKTNTVVWWFIEKLKTIFYRLDLEKQEGFRVVVLERLTEPRVTMEWLLLKGSLFSNLLAFLDLNGSYFDCHGQNC